MKFFKWILVFSLFLFVSCATIFANQSVDCVCPSQDIVIVMQNTNGQKQFLYLPKGILSPRFHGKNWITVKEYVERLDQFQREQEEFERKKHEKDFTISYGKDQ